MGLLLDYKRRGGEFKWIRAGISASRPIRMGFVNVGS